MRMRSFVSILGFSVTAFLSGRAQQLPQGPFPPDQWPASADANKVVHFVSVDDAFQPLGNSWVSGNMNILSGGDQVTAPIQIGGFSGLKVTGNYLNVADHDYTEWADNEEIDILMQVYGDGALFSSSGDPRNFNFLIGTLPPTELDSPVGGQIPVDARNQKWNWVLFRIPNTIRPSDGLRRVGSLPPNAQGDTSAGGVNGGTIRVQTVPNLIVRVVAFGEKGAFGETNQVNIFTAPPACEPEPATNLAWIDLNGDTNHLQLLNDRDQTVTVQSGVGPATDQRRAARPNGQFMNFGITSNYLGFPCNDARSVKICLEFYDDPALAGTKFGPEAYATDAQGGTGSVAADRRQTLAGSGVWVQRSWTIPAVNLFGVNTAPLTGGPRLIFEDGVPIFISKFELGILRTGTNALAGVDPLPDCFDDPNFCAGIYGNFAEMDLASGVMDGLEPGTSGGDQQMIQDEAGPTNDRRLAIRPASDDGTGAANRFLNFAITDEKLGPSSQPNVLLAVCVTYYDDPALAGATFRPEVYQSDQGGNIGLAFTSPDVAVPLEGTDKWRTAYFEIPDMKFLGVNQGPQAAARFVVSDAPGTQPPIAAKIFFTRVRYGVIRPCGPDANVNPVADCKPAPGFELAAVRNPDGSVRITWPVAATGFGLQQNNNIGSTNTWAGVTQQPLIEGTTNVVTFSAPTGTLFFRLANIPPP
jgi:hypothetical protein